LTNKDFEEYYPRRFAEKINKVLALTHGKGKQQAKKEILDEVLKWINSNTELAIKEFKISAKEVIDILCQIEKNIVG
jgi:hypothetical protein